MRILMIILSIVFTLHLSATIINIPADQPTIQEGINVSVDGDTVLVQTGIYIENINYSGMNITVASYFLTTQDTSYISQTIIDGNQIGSVVTFENGENNTANLIGFTITNGWGPSMTGGGGIAIFNNSNPILSDLIIIDNFTPVDGGGIYCVGNSNPHIKNIQIANNHANFTGGGIFCHNSNPIVENVIISDNFGMFEGGGIWCVYDSNPTLINVLITGNSSDFGGGLYCRDNTNMKLINVTFTENNSFSSGSGIYSWNSNIILINCILWIDTPHEEIFSGNNCNIYVAYSDIQNGWEGIGNINSDPIFVNPGDGEFHLADNSPCIGSGIDEIEINENWYYAPDFDLEGNPRPDPAESMPDMGAYENPFGEPQVSSDNFELQISNTKLMNHPNPFNPTTTIEFSIQNNSKVELIIYNIKGQKINSLAQNEFTKGSHSIIWDGNNETGIPVSSGLYLYKLNVNGKTEAVNKCLLLK